jgi:hypothetical protein
MRFRRCGRLQRCGRQRWRWRRWWWWWWALATPCNRWRTTAQAACRTLGRLSPAVSTAWGGYGPRLGRVRAPSPRLRQLLPPRLGPPRTPPLNRRPLSSRSRAPPSRAARTRPLGPVRLRTRSSWAAAARLHHVTAFSGLRRGRACGGHGFIPERDLPPPLQGGWRDRHGFGGGAERAGHGVLR